MCCFQLGEGHDRTKESSECLKHLTQQAVVLQKKMNEIYKGDKSISFPPIQVSPYGEKKGKNPHDLFECSDVLVSFKLALHIHTRTLSHRQLLQYTYEQAFNQHFLDLVLASQQAANIFLGQMKWPGLHCSGRNVLKEGWPFVELLTEIEI